MGKSQRIALIAVAAGLGLPGCGGPTAPDSSEEVEIVLSVSGGLAGQDWQYTVDGRTGRVVGDRCAGPVGCDWEAGQELATFESDALTPLAREFFTRGFFDGPDDHGTERCDQLHYGITYRDDNRTRTVRGSSGVLPGALVELIGSVERFVADRRAERLEGGS